LLHVSTACYRHSTIHLPSTPLISTRQIPRRLKSLARNDVLTLQHQRLAYPLALCEQNGLDRSFFLKQTNRFPTNPLSTERQTSSWPANVTSRPRQAHVCSRLHIITIWQHKGRIGSATGFIYIVAWAATPDTRGPSPHLLIYQAGRSVLFSQQLHCHSLALFHSR
jgi:hypothetical protein